jgi:hypothetical protein
MQCNCVERECGCVVWKEGWDHRRNECSRHSNRGGYDHTVPDDGLLTAINGNLNLQLADLPRKDHFVNGKLSVLNTHRRSAPLPKRIERDALRLLKTLLKGLHRVCVCESSN